MEIQHQALVKYAESQGFLVDHEHGIYRDEGFSGAIMDRPALKQMFEDASE